MYKNSYHKNSFCVSFKFIVIKAIKIRIIIKVTTIIKVTDRNTEIKNVSNFQIKGIQKWVQNLL